VHYNVINVCVYVFRAFVTEGIRLFNQNYFYSLEYIGQCAIESFPQDDFADIIRTLSTCGKLLIHSFIHAFVHSIIHVFLNLQAKIK